MIHYRRMLTDAAARYLAGQDEQGYVYALVHPNGIVVWGKGGLDGAKKTMGNYGTGSAWADEQIRLRLLAGDCSLLFPKEFPANDYARKTLALIGQRPLEEVAPMRGPIAFWYFDPSNEWDNTRTMTEEEEQTLAMSLMLAGCTWTAEGEPRR